MLVPWQARSHGPPPLASLPVLFSIHPSLPDIRVSFGTERQLLIPLKTQHCKTNSEWTEKTFYGSENVYTRVVLCTTGKCYLSTVSCVPSLLTEPLTLSLLLTCHLSPGRLFPPLYWSDPRTGVVSPLSLHTQNLAELAHSSCSWNVWLINEWALNINQSIQITVPPT